MKPLLLLLLVPTLAFPDTTMPHPSRLSRCGHHLAALRAELAHQGVEMSVEEQDGEVRAVAGAGGCPCQWSAEADVKLIDYRAHRGWHRRGDSWFAQAGLRLGKV